jgi:hypothetical protein
MPSATLGMGFLFEDQCSSAEIEESLLERLHGTPDVSQKVKKAGDVW